MTKKDRDIKIAMRLIAKYQENETYQEKRADDDIRRVARQFTPEQLAEVLTCSDE